MSSMRMFRLVLGRNSQRGVKINPNNDSMTTIEKLTALVGEMRALTQQRDHLGAMLLAHRIGREVRARVFELLAPCRVVIGNETFVRGGSPESVLSEQELAELRALKDYLGYGI